jgi:HSP20 family molecular chaperone IbpA
VNKQLPVPVAGQLNADVYETPGGNAYMIEVPVAGLKPDEILVEVRVDTITVRIQPRRTYLQREQSLQPMSRIFDLPMDPTRTTCTPRLSTAS